MKMTTSKRKSTFISVLLLLFIIVPLNAVIKEEAKFYDTVNTRKELFLNTNSNWKKGKNFQRFSGSENKKVGIKFERRKDGGYDLMFFPAYRGEKDDKTFGKIIYSFSLSDSFSDEDKIEKVRFHYLENNGCYVEFYTDWRTGKQFFDIYLFGQQYESNIEFNFNINKLKFLSSYEILNAVNKYYPIENILNNHENDSEIKGNFIQNVIKKSLAEFADDGALNEQGEFVSIKTGTLLPAGKQGLNCSGFIKEIYDQYLQILNPQHKRLPIDILKTKDSNEENAYRQQHRQHENYDPFFGKDWVENLNREFNELSGITSQHAEELTYNEYSPYFDAKGFRFSDLPYIIFKEQQKNPLYFYVVVFNKYSDNKRLIPEYYHISVLVPYFKGKHFYLRVFESGEETSFENLVNIHIPHEIPASVFENIMEHRLAKKSSSYELMEKSYQKVNGKRSYRMKKNISADDKLRLARVLSDAEYEEEKVLIYKVPISYHFYK